MAKKEKVVEVNSSNQVVLDKSDTMGPWQIAWNRFRKNKIAMAGLIIFALIVLAVIFVPMLSGVHVNDYDFAAKNLAPSAEHWLGTDEQGRDVFFRLFLGGRISILVGVFAATLTVLFGCVIGGIAGYYGGWIDNLLMRFAEIVYSLPFTPLILVIASIMMWTPSEIKMYLVSFLIGIFILAGTCTFSTWTDFIFTRTRVYAGLRSSWFE